MHSNAANLVVAGAALLLGTVVPLASAIPLEGEPQKLYRSLLKREPPSALPPNASDDELKWQPSMDFDRDGCYNTPAIDADGNVAEGLDNNFTTGPKDCRDESDLDNNNVYVRTRCNNGWCAYMYDYYFEKDVGLENIFDVAGHRHDWEHVVVFVEGDELRLVSVSAHGEYEKKAATDDTLYIDGDTHAKVVYHKDGAGTHAFRFASKNDDNIENHKGEWFRGPLVGWESGFPGDTRNILSAHDFGSANLGIKDDSFSNQLKRARNEVVTDFDDELDE